MPAPLTKTDVARKFHDAHGKESKFGYDWNSYVNMTTKMKIHCEDHGWFKQTPNSHERGHGCPKCRTRVSKAEIEIREFVAMFVGEDEVIPNDREVLGGLELDIYIPSKNLAIEYCGIYWHSHSVKKDKCYHMRKYEACAALGIRLLTIFEDEWINAPSRVKEAIRSALVDQDDRAARVSEWTVGLIDGKAVRKFLDQYHTHGSDAGMGEHYGLIDNEGQVVAVMSFDELYDQIGNCRWRMQKFAKSQQAPVGAERELLNAFMQAHPGEGIFSLADRRWSDGAVQRSLGFKHDGIVGPACHYFRGTSRYHKGWCFEPGDCEIAPSISDEALAERELMEWRGYESIYDCGHDRWVLEP